VRWPALQPLLTNNFVRGAVTGLGIVNLVAGFLDLALIFGGRPQRPMSMSDGSRP